MFSGDRARSSQGSGRAWRAAGGRWGSGSACFREATRCSRSQPAALAGGPARWRAAGRPRRVPGTLGFRGAHRRGRSLRPSERGRTQRPDPKSAAPTLPNATGVRSSRALPGMLGANAPALLRFAIQRCGGGSSGPSEGGVNQGRGNRSAGAAVHSC